MIAAAIWIPVFHLSDRVMNTFVMRLKPPVDLPHQGAPEALAPAVAPAPSPQIPASDNVAGPHPGGPSA